MATSTSRRAHPRRAARAKPVAAKKLKPAAHRRRKAPKAAHRTAKKTKRPVVNAASAVLKSFAKLLGSVRASAASMTAEQRARLQKAMKHAHAALD